MPPNLARKALVSFLRDDLVEEVVGDLEEKFYLAVKNKSLRRAQLNYWCQVFSYVRPFAIRKSKSVYTTHYAMLQNYFKIGWRNLSRNTGYSAINIGGLAMGMAITMIIGLWVYDELSFNKYFKNYNHIAQVMKAGTFDGKRYQGLRYLQFPLIGELETTYGSNFKHVVPISGPGGWEGVLSTPEKKITKTGMYIGEAAPEMFTWKMIYGAWSGLKDPHSIMLSESTARALFGGIDPVGRGVKLNSTTDVTVTGVYEDFPKNTEFYGIEFFEPWTFYLIDAPWIKEQGWQNHFLWVYVEIQPNRSFEEVAASIKDAEISVTKNLDYMQDWLKYDPEVSLLPMRDWHLYSDFKEGVLQHGPVQLVWFIGSIGAFVLLLACINFMNLSTARSGKRWKEVGIRKTMGSIQRQLIAQFFSESFLVVFMAFMLAAGLVLATIPWFNQLAAKEMRLPWDEQWFWFSCIAFLLMTGILAGSYPALYLSSFDPVKILKGTFRTHRLASVPRKVLVVLQFTVSVTLIVCTGVIYNQLMFVKNRPVGYDREGLLMIRKKTDAFNTKADVLRAELKSTGVVSELAESGGDVTGVWSNNGGFLWEDKDPAFEASFATLNVSPEFGKTVGWEFIEGRDFSAEIASDSAAFVLNESAVKYMGLEDPVGKTVRWTNLAWGVDQDFRIVGVIKDMIMDSPFEPVKPTIYLTFGYERVLLVRITPGVSVSEALPKIEDVFARVIPEIPFDYKFADEEYARKFSTEERIGKLAGVFAILAVIISCLGLFGLASFVAEQRTKEIGIRKVLGASVASLWKMLSREFVLLVIFSCLIAVPISYYILLSGLENYEYKAKIGWWIFAAASLGALVITLLTVSFQAIKAALMNPVKSLRME